MEQQSFFAHQYARALAAAVLAAAVFALCAFGYASLKEAQYNNWGPTTINVRGEGEVLAKPDIGSFSFTVRAEGADAAGAQEESARIMNDILTYLKDEGVEEKDIKTQYYNLNPKYRYEERLCQPGSYCPPGEPIIDGYEASQNVVVKVHDLDAAGDLISGVGERRAENISGLSFTIDDETALKEEARAKAIADAKEKAKELASDLGVRIVKMQGYWEEEYYPEAYGYGGDMMMERAVMSFDDGAAMAPELPTGESTTRSVVNITYEVR